MQDEDTSRRRYERVASVRDERGRRAVAASEAVALGWGGVTVSDADLAALELERAPFHDARHSTIRPHSTPNGVAAA